MNLVIFIIFVVALLIVLAIAVRQSNNNVNSAADAARKRATDRALANSYADTKPAGLDLATTLSTTVIEGDANLLSDEQKKIIETLFDGKPVTIENITMDKYSDYWKNARFK